MRHTTSPLQNAHINPLNESTRALRNGLNFSLILIMKFTFGYFRMIFANVANYSKIIVIATCKLQL